MTPGGRFALIVLDGLGIGTCPDQADWGDAGSDTLGNVARAVAGFDLPHLAALGLGCCRALDGMACEAPAAAFGVALPAAQGKDSTTGHWELCELVLRDPFPTYPDGFPGDVIARFAEATGRGVLANRAASGTAVIEEFGVEHMRSGAWIVYTSADSVFQVAAHEHVVPVEELYAACELARREILVDRHTVSRVIARPFVGVPGNFTRTGRRRDFSVAPPGETLLDRLAAAGVPRVGVGKVDDLFAGRHIESVHTPVNADAYQKIGDALRTMDCGFLFANVLEFDQSWGHRNDVAGFHEGLRELDTVLPDLLDTLREGDLLVLTADHGNDPTTPSTDHSREAVPVLVAGPGVAPASLGDRTTFADVGATAAEFFGLAPAAGTSFLSEVAPWTIR